MVTKDEKHGLQSQNLEDFCEISEECFCFVWVFIRSVQTLPKNSNVGFRLQYHRCYTRWTWHIGRLFCWTVWDKSDTTFRVKCHKYISWWLPGGQIASERTRSFRAPLVLGSERSAWRCIPHTVVFQTLTLPLGCSITSWDTNVRFFFQLLSCVKL